MGIRGPVPNRTEDLARPRERNGEARQLGDVTQGQMMKVTIPAADKDWHPIAKKIYNSVRTSGQKQFYQNSDWAVLYSLMEDLSHYKKSGKRSGQMAATIYSALTSLMLTEGDRRRARLELMPDGADEESASLYAISDYKSALEVAE